jgi:oligopeptide transport system substrate-binding protein
MASLQEYLDAEGMTIEDFNALGVTLMHNTSEGHALIAAAIQQMWADNLGVEVTVENQEWKVYLDTIGKDTDIDQVPHVFRLGWCADYPDENNWIHEVFNSDEGANRVRTDNADFNALTVAAGEADDPAEREALYEQAEQMFAEEMVAFAPIYHYTTVNVTHQWLTRNFPPLGANDFYNWTLDDAARGQ